MAHFDFILSHRRFVHLRCLRLLFSTSTSRKLLRRLDLDDSSYDMLGYLYKESVVYIYKATEFVNFLQADLGCRIRYAYPKSCQPPNANPPPPIPKHATAAAKNRLVFLIAMHSE